MFESKKRKYPLYRLDKTLDEYRQEADAPVEIGSIRAFIAPKTHAPYNANDLRMQEVTHIGLTRDKGAERGMLVGGYLVEFVDDGGVETILYLKEVAP